MRWFFEELRLAWRQVKRTEIWLFLGVLAGFFLLAAILAQFAFQTDSILRFLHLTITSCSEMTNGPIIFMFCGMIFFLLAAAVTFGEIQRYYYFRRRNVHHETRRAMRNGILAATAAVLIAIAAMYFFKNHCRYW